MPPTSPSRRTKVIAALTLLVAVGALVALVAGASTAADVLLLAVLAGVGLFALSNHGDTRDQSGR